MLTKRVFIYLIVASIVFFLLFRWWKALRALLFRPGKQVARPVRVENSFREGPNRILASMVRADDPDSGVRTAVDLLGGWEKIGVRGKKILVKPNVVAGDPPPTTTSPEVIRAIVTDLYRHGASQVWVGDMSALRTLPTKKNMEKTGIRKAAEDAGARVLHFEEHGWVRVPTPQGRYVKEVDVTEWIFRVDRIVNVPVVKTHHSAVYSIALKNFVGATHGRMRPYWINPLHWEEVVAELNLAYTPHLNIVDGTTIMVKGGPWHGRPQKTNLVIASGDRIAADLVGLGLIKKFRLWEEVAEKGVWEQKQVRRAAELGLGISAPEELRLLSGSLRAEDREMEDLVRTVESYLGLAGREAVSQSGLSKPQVSSL
jgi:uncharacterized protein (DUF362 family)